MNVRDVKVEPPTVELPTVELPTFHRHHVERASWIVTAICTFCWGMSAILSFNLLDMFFGRGSIPGRILYGCFGIAGLFSAYTLIDRLTNPTMGEQVNDHVRRMI